MNYTPNFILHTSTPYNNHTYRRSSDKWWSLIAANESPLIKLKRPEEVVVGAQEDEGSTVDCFVCLFGSDLREENKKMVKEGDRLNFLLSLRDL